MDDSYTSEKLYNPMELYTLNTMPVDLIAHQDETEGGENQITRFFWYSNPLLLGALCKYLQRRNIRDNIIDVGCGFAHFPLATHLLDFNTTSSNSDKTIFKLDLDFEKFLYQDAFFNFVYCRHVLEDIQNPQNAFNEFVRISKSGYIETPSPLVELMRGVDSFGLHRGYIHHRYFVWSDYATNTLFFLPKYPLIESRDYDFNELFHLPQKYDLLNKYPVYWNNYYIWDETRSPKIIVYRNGINMEIRSDYLRLLQVAIMSSIEYTNYFIAYLKC